MTEIFFPEPHVLNTYRCSLCGLTESNLAEMIEHIKIPVDFRFPHGLVYKDVKKQDTNVLVIRHYDSNHHADVGSIDIKFQSMRYFAYGGGKDLEREIAEGFLNGKYVFLDPESFENEVQMSKYPTEMTRTVKEFGLNDLIFSIPRDSLLEIVGGRK